jgi:hypothetical protein
LKSLTFRPFACIPKAIYIGEGDFHDIKYDDTEEIIQLSASENPETTRETNLPGQCSYSFHTYSSSRYVNFTYSNAPKRFTITIVCVVLILALSFVMYDKAVYRRNVKIVNASLRSNRVVSSIFPSHIRDKLLAEPDTSERDNRSLASHMLFTDGPNKKTRSQSIGFGESVGTLCVPDLIEDDLSVLFSSKPPIADLFPETTIMFADIAGFTNWSSAREPTQVFTLLGTYKYICMT